jgi:hypothetical protein
MSAKDIVEWEERRVFARHLAPAAARPARALEVSVRSPWRTPSRQTIGRCCLCRPDENVFKRY